MNRETHIFNCVCGAKELREHNDAPWPTCRKCRAAKLRDRAAKSAGAKPKRPGR